MWPLIAMIAGKVGQAQQKGREEEEAKEAQRNAATAEFANAAMKPAFEDTEEPTEDKPVDSAQVDFDQNEEDEYQRRAKLGALYNIKSKEIF